MDGPSDTRIMNNAAILNHSNNEENAGLGSILSDLLLSIITFFL